MNVILNMPVHTDSLPYTLYNQLHSGKILVVEIHIITDMQGALTLNQKSSTKGLILITNHRCRGYLVCLCENPPSLPSCLSSVLGDEKF